MFAEGQLPQTVFVRYNNDPAYGALFHCAVTYGQTVRSAQRDTAGLMSKQIRTPLAMILIPVAVQTKAAICCRKDSLPCLRILRLVRSSNTH